MLKVIYKILHSPNQTIVSSISFAILEKARELQLHVKVYYYLINDILLKQSYMCLISSRIEATTVNKNDLNIEKEVIRCLYKPIKCKTTPFRFTTEIKKYNLLGFKCLEQLANHEHKLVKI